MSRYNPAPLINPSYQINPPSSFNFPNGVPFHIWRNPLGQIVTDFDASTYANTSGTSYYVDVNSGSDMNAGTQAAPYKTIYKALQTIGTTPHCTIWVKNGTYFRKDSSGNFQTFGGVPVTVSVNVRMWPGTTAPVYIVAADQLTWSVNGTYANVYQAARSSVYAVVDNASSGLYADNPSVSTPVYDETALTQVTAVIGTLSSALSTGAAITSLPVNALTGAVSTGDSVVVSSGNNTQIFTASSAAAIGAISISVNSLTPNFAYPSGSSVQDTNTALATLHTSPNSWYTDDTTVYVYLQRNSVTTAPDNNLWALFNVNNWKQSGNLQCYLEGLTFIGGNSAVCSVVPSASADAPILAAKNCVFARSGAYNTTTGTNNNAVSVLGATAYFQNCVARHGQADQFNYHNGSPTNTTPSTFIEVGCTARGGITSGDTNDNGSTSHDKSTGIRVNGFYGRTYGPAVADVLGAQTWNVGLRAFNSLATQSAMTSLNTPYQNASFQTTQPNADSTLSKMWLDSCSAIGSQYDIMASSGCFIYLRNTDYRVQSTATAGVVANY